MLPKFTSIKSRVIAGASLLVIAGSALVPASALAGTAAVDQHATSSATAVSTGRGPSVAVSLINQVGIAVADGRGRNPRNAAVSQDAQGDATAVSTGRGSAVALSKINQVGVAHR